MIDTCRDSLKKRVCEGMKVIGDEKEMVPPSDGGLSMRLFLGFGFPSLPWLVLGRKRRRKDKWELSMTTTLMVGLIQR